MTKKRKARGLQRLSALEYDKMRGNRVGNLQRMTDAEYTQLWNGKPELWDSRKLDISNETNASNSTIIK